jgi:hypothetical protein
MAYSRRSALDATAELALLAEVRRPEGRDAAFRALFDAYRAPVLGLCLHPHRHARRRRGRDAGGVPDSQLGPAAFPR